MARTCDVLLNTNECEAPPGSAGTDAICTTCWACGQAACKTCSAIIPWRGREHRVCNDCQEQEREPDPRPSRYF